MNYNDFVIENKKLLDELSNKLILSPTEESLKQCCAAIFIKIVEKYPNMNLDSVTEHAWKIVEVYLLPLTQDKQRYLLNFMNPGMSKQMLNNKPMTKNDDFGITLGAAWGLGIGIFILCLIFGANETFSDGTISMICMISVFILWVIPKKK